MIRVVMLGRAGNNLFQYALGRVLADRHGVPLVMDGSWFNREGWSSVSCLRRLPLRAEIVRPLTLGSRALRKLTGKHYWQYLGLQEIGEKPASDQRFNPAFLNAPASSLLMGYFQSPRYFAGHEKKLRGDLDMDLLPWRPQTLRMADRLASESSVAVHVRRTDYVKKAIYSVCSIGYYRRSMDLLRSRLPGLRFHLFSDDPAWCHAHLAGPDAEVCSLGEAEGDPLHDMFLMSCARHHIIANSSYSWWAAWLGKNPERQVLMPDLWFRQDIIAPIEEKQLPGWEIVESGAKEASNE
jgi:hypothetical protein